MKRIFCISVAVLGMVVSAFAADLTEQQQKLKSEIIDDLKISNTVTITEEGLIIINDGFSDYPFFLSIEPADFDQCVYAKLYIQGEYGTYFTKKVISRACQMNAKHVKTVKTYCNDSGYIVATEMFIYNAKNIDIVLTLYKREINRVFSNVLPRDCEIVLERMR